MTYKLTLCYDGTRYLGWQRLGGEDAGRTIQGKLEAIVEKLTGQAVEVHGSGRTDAGVHAEGQVASFRTSYDTTPEELLAYMNRYLPEDIAVLAVEEAPERFHARLHARAKTYRYVIRNADAPDPFRARYEYRVTEPLDLQAMREAAAIFVGTHDFRELCASKRTKKSTVRTIYSIDVAREGALITIAYRGDGFLYNMVRILTGTLIEVGLGRRTAQSVTALLDTDRRQRAGYTAPAKGLTLVSVEY